MSWHATVLTLFPDLFPGTLEASVVGKALSEGLWSLETINIRDFATDSYKTVDDTPFGGGAGMVLRPDVVDRALQAAFPDQRPQHLVYVSPRGVPLTQELVRTFAAADSIGILCGRYEGVDQRVLDAWQMEEVSIGDYVLSGGELAAQVILDACVRLLPGVLGAAESTHEESFENNLLEYPHFTRPREWNACNVPEVLLSGNHEKIRKWRLAQREALTKTRRPDLWQRYCQEKPPTCTD